MKTNKKLLFMIITLMIAFVGCKKYDDGPTFSPWPAKWRVVNTWKIEKTITAGQTTTGSDDYTIEFKGDGTAISTVIFLGSTITTEGTWEFGSKKETLRVTFGSSTSEETILRLTSNELWVKDIAGFETETHYISAK